MQILQSKRDYALVLLAFCLALFIPLSSLHATIAAPVSSPFVYTFNANGTLYEAGTMSDSSTGYWWLNSGGKLVIKDGVGSTIQGALATVDTWSKLYNTNSPSDTDSGTHPQNLFRLVSRSQWENAHVEALFKVNKDNFSTSPNRNNSNGLLLMLRYQAGGQTLYYAGVRVDGTAVLKKKINGIYYTMAQKQVFPGTYVAGGSVNLLPHNQWMLLGADTITNANGSVTVRLSLRKPGEATATKILEVVDNGQFGGTAAIKGAGYIGIRTDFMDVAFDTFKAIKI
jgi:hypothetical protein